MLLNHRRGGVGPLAAALQASDRWRLVYADDVSVIFVRSDADPARWPALDLGAPGTFDSLDGVDAVAAGPRLFARARLLHELGRPDLVITSYSIHYTKLYDLLIIKIQIRSIGPEE